MMSSVLIHKVSEMRPQTRAALEVELGRSLGDDEEVSIMAFEPHPAPTEDARRQAVRGLQEHFHRTDQSAKHGSAEEMEEALDEALRSVRPGYREHE
ncbi:MAG TPA: hypothetical protein VFZ08_03895 [Terriglobia bacterium]|nr:hypothetical protein [Terriglobia bacterium]